MIRRFALMIAVLALVLVPAVSASQTPAATQKSKVMDAVQGQWLFTSVDGQDLAGSGQEIVIVIKDNTYTQSINGQVVERGTFKLDESKKPVALDILVVEGDDAGMSQVGVVEVTDKGMRGKVGEPGTTVRPTDFAPAEGFFTFVAVKKM